MGDRPRNTEVVSSNSWVAVSPHNSTNLAVGVRALYVGVSGDISIVAPDDTVATFKSVPVGILPVQAKRVNSTATTATDMIALY